MSAAERIDLCRLLADARDAMAEADKQLLTATNKGCLDPRCFDPQCPKRSAILRMREVSERIDAAIVTAIKTNGEEITR